MPPFDSVVSVGGQSFVDGLWRVLGPALQGLTNPLPLSIPGLSNARMRITNLIPDFPGNPPATGALKLRARVELVAEAVMHVLKLSETINVDLPAQEAAISNLLLSGGAINLGPGTGSIDIPAVTAPLSGIIGANSPNPVPVPGIPFPAVVPVALDLTPTRPLTLEALVSLALTGPDAATRSSLRFDIANAVMEPVGGFDLPSLVTSVTAELQSALDKIVARLGNPLPIPQIDPTAIEALLAPIPTLVSQAFDDALSGLTGETGRLLYPGDGAGASCGAELLPTAGQARLAVTSAGTYLLQVGFERAGSSDLPAFPTFTPSGATDTSVLIGNNYLLRAICCLVERLPGLSLPVVATTGTVDVAGNSHTACCNFTGVTANFAGIAIGGGGLSVCLDGEAGRPKRLSLVGRFRDRVEIDNFPDPAEINIDFTLPLAFDLDDAASVSDLRLSGNPTVTVDVNVPLTFQLAILGLVAGIAALLGAAIGGGVGGIFGSLIGALAGLIGGAIIGASVGVIAGVTIAALVVVASKFARYLLNRAVRTLLGPASLVKSPITIPPGVFDALGKFASSTEILDDLMTFGVLHTPTSPFALLPRIGVRRRPIDDRPIDPKPPTERRPKPKPRPPRKPLTASTTGVRKSSRARP